MVEIIEPHNFSFNKPLGQKGSSEKWKGKFVAVKRFEGGCRPSSVPQFTKEVTQIGKLNHENLVKLIGFCDQRKNTYLVFEMQKGGSLFDFLQEPSHIITWRMCIGLIQELVNGLTYMHDNNILHLNLNSSNIMYHKEKNQLKICDYGLNKIRAMTSTPQSRTLAKSCSVRWMSPEVRKATNSSKKSDVWSFGCVLLEFATREIPFENLSDKAVVAMLENDTTFIPVVYKNWLNTPSQIDALIAKCLKRDPFVRPFFTDMKNSLSACDIKLYENKTILKERKSEISSMETLNEVTTRPASELMKCKMKETGKLNEKNETSAAPKSASDILKFTIYDKIKYENSMKELDLKIKQQEAMIKSLHGMLEIRKSINETEKSFSNEKWDLFKPDSLRKLTDELDSIHNLICDITQKTLRNECLKTLSDESHSSMCCSSAHRSFTNDNKVEEESQISEISAINEINDDNKFIDSSGSESSLDSIGEMGSKNDCKTD